ncbi:MAG: hypothetical protein CW691_01840, partial [Candidatus Bathyarchaeum sp.]
ALLLLDTWHFIEFEGLIDSTEGYFKEYFDGELLDSETSLNTSSVGSFTRIRLGNNETGSVDYYIDDFVVSDVYIGPNYIFENGFEQGDFSAWDSTNGTVSVVNTDRHNGDYALKCEGSSDYVTKTIPSTTNVWVRAYWKTEAIPVTDYYSGYICSGNGFEARWNTMTGNGRWDLQIDGSYGGSYTQSITPDVWYCVEVEFDADNNQHYMYIDGVQRISCTNATTTAITSINVGQISANWGENTYVDCVVISDSYIGVIEELDDGFESGDFSAWSGTTGSPSVQSSVVHSGSYAMLATQGDYVTYSTDLESSYVRFYVRFSAIPTSDWSANYYMRWRNVTNASDLIYFGIYRGTDSNDLRWTFRTLSPSVDNGYYTDSTPTIDTWYCVEIYYHNDDFWGEYRWYLDGEFADERTRVNTEDGGNAELLYLGGWSTTAGNVYIDDVVVSHKYTGPEEAEQVFADGFESGDWSQWSSYNSTYDSIVASPVHHGSYAAEFEATGVNNAASKTNLAPSSEMFLRHYVRFSDTIDSGAVIVLSSIDIAGFTMVKNNGGQMQWGALSNHDNGYFFVDATIVPNTWYCLELRCLKGSSTGEIQLYVDDTSVINQTGRNMNTSDFSSIQLIGQIISGSSTLNVYHDCVSVATTYIGAEEGEEPPTGAEAGFETGDVSEFDDTVTSSGTITATDSVAHHGTYSCKCDVNADGSAYAEGYFDVAEQQPVYCRGYFRFNQLPETNKDYTLICFENTDGPTTVGYIQLIDDNGTKQWKMMRSTGSAQYSTSTSNIPSVDTWVCVEFAHGENLAKLWVDGDELLTHTDATDQTIDRVHVGACSTDMDADDTLEIHTDCIIVTDEYIGPESEVQDLEVSNLTINDGSTGNDPECGRLNFDEDNQSEYWMVTKRGSGYSEPDNLVFSYWDGSNWHQLIDLDPVADCVKLNEGKLQLSNSEVPHLDKLEIVKAIFDFKHGEWGPVGLPVANANTKITFEETDEDLNGHLFEIVSDTPAFNEIEPLLATDRGLVVQKDIAAGGFVSANQGELYLGFGREHRLSEPAIRLSFADASKLNGGGMANIPPVPRGLAGEDLPEYDPETNQGYFLHTNPAVAILYYDNNTAWEDVTVEGQVFWNQTTDEIIQYITKDNVLNWYKLGDPSDFGGNFDTVYVRKGFFNTPANMNLGDLTSKKVIMKAPNDSDWIDIQTVMMLGSSPILHIDQGVMGVKDLFCLGFLGSESPTRLTFSEQDYTDCVPSDIGKAVEDDGVELSNTVLADYDNENRMWRLSRPHSIASGSEMTIVDGTGVGTTSAASEATGGGAIQLGQGFEREDDPPRINLTDSGDHTLYITSGSSLSVGADAILANMKLNDLTATQLAVESTNNLFAVSAGDNGENQDTYLIPQNPSQGGLGLGTAAYPFKWIDATTVFTDGINCLTNDDITITPYSGKKIILDG